ncbi:MAG: PqqD family protein [Anaerolineae bacterium]|nr:PqqD family protein [Anaerolineae bacterium]
MAAIYVLNETAARIWELLDGRSSLEVVRDALVQEFAVDLDRAQADLLQVVSELSELHLIGPVDDDVS